MRGHVGFDVVLFKIQHVRVFFCHCWVKMKPFLFPLHFFLGEEKQEYLTLTKASFGELPRQGSFPVGAEPHGHSRASGVSDRSVHLHLWERKSRN